MNCTVLIWHPNRDENGHPVVNKNCQYNGQLLQIDITKFLEGHLANWCSTQGCMPLSFASGGFGISESLRHAFWIGKWMNGASADTATLEMIW